MEFLCVTGSANEFELPYTNDVPSDPSVAHMKDVVCVQKKRPLLPAEWTEREVIRWKLHFLTIEWIRLNEWMSIDWLIDWLSGGFINWLVVDWLIDRLIVDWLIDWLVDWLIDWSFDWSFDWLIDSSFVFSGFFCQPMNTLSRLMRECWHQDPQARLTALRVKKTLAELLTTESVKVWAGPTRVAFQTERNFAPGFLDRNSRKEKDRPTAQNI